jgi:hypothetical protein
VGKKTDLGRYSIGMTEVPGKVDTVVSNVFRVDDVVHRESAITKPTATTPQAANDADGGSSATPAAPEPKLSRSRLSAASMMGCHIRTTATKAASLAGGFAGFKSSEQKEIIRRRFEAPGQLLTLR